jgi:RHS repeat-associated protein
MILTSKRETPRVDEEPQTNANNAYVCATSFWGQSFTYDRYGNLTAMTNSATGQGCAALYSMSMTANSYNQLSGLSYDASGNTTSDGSFSYTWNGEGLLQSAGSTTYTYDGDDKRVEKSSGVYYWFSPDGSPLAETNASGATLNEYVYFGGARTARRDSSGNVYYYFSDPVGTARLMYNATSGAVCYDADYTPFGQELAYTTSCTQNYKFTGMERDTETENDHTWFREYEFGLGRWLGPDRLSGDVSNPQSLNRYAYVLNNPLSLTDPLGLEWCAPGSAVYGNDGNLIGYDEDKCISDQDYDENYIDGSYTGYFYVDPQSFTFAYSPGGQVDDYDTAPGGDLSFLAEGGGNDPPDEQLTQTTGSLFNLSQKGKVCEQKVQNAVNAALDTSSTYVGPQMGGHQDDPSDPGLINGAYNFIFFAPGVQFGAVGAHAVPGANCGRFSGSGLHIPVNGGGCNPSGDPNSPFGFNAQQNGSYFTAHIDSENPFDDVAGLFGHLINNVILRRKHGC